MPYLPGDTVIFIAATFATTDALSYPLLWLTIFIFSVLGDTLNYGMGYWFGHYITQRKNRRFIKNNHLEQTRQFYQKYGGKTILFSRYIPVIRSFAPFLGGVGELPFKKYLLFDLLGVFLWSGLYLNLGYFFGAIPWVQDNLAIVIPVVVVGTMIPAFIVTRVTKKDMQKDMQKEPNKAE
jgi:membrane-associated protein